MARKKHKPEEIIQHLRTLEIESSRGGTIEQVARSIGVNPVTLSRWKKEYGGLKVDQARRLKDLEKENSRLKKIVANQAIDIDFLKDVNEGKF
jgi:putative transposase